MGGAPICRPGCKELVILHVAVFDVEAKFEPFVLSRGAALAIVNAHPEQASALAPACPIWSLLAPGGTVETYDRPECIRHM